MLRPDCDTAAACVLLNDEAEFFDVIQNLVSSHARINTTDLLNALGEKDCNAEISGEQLLDDIAGSSVQDDAESDGGCDGETPTIASNPSSITGRFPASLPKWVTN